MSKGSKLLHGAFGAAMALEAGCGGAALNTPNRYEVAVPLQSSADDHRSLTDILQECVFKFQGDVHKCLSVQDQTLASFAKAYRDRAKEYEKGEIPDVWNQFNSTSFEQYTKDHPDIRFELDENKTSIKSVGVKRDGTSRKFTFEPALELRLYPYAVSLVEKTLERVTDVYGKDQYYKETLLSKAFFDPTKIDMFTVKSGSLVFFQSDNNGQWIAFGDDLDQLRINSVVSMNDKEVLHKCPLPGCADDPESKTTMDEKGYPFVSVTSSQSTQINNYSYPSPVCLTDTAWYEGGVNSKQWSCSLPNGMRVNASAYPGEKVAKEKRASIKPEMVNPESVQFSFPATQGLDMNVRFHSNGMPYEFERQRSVEGKWPQVRLTTDRFFYSPALKRSYYSATKLEILGTIEIGTDGYRQARMVLKDGSTMEVFPAWQKKQKDAGKKDTLNDYFEALAPKMAFPLDFYSFAKLQGRENVQQAMEKGGTVSEQMWKSVYMFQEILKRQGVKSAIINPGALMSASDLKKLPEKFRSPLVVWLTKRTNNNFDINYANLLNVGRNGAEYNPEADREGNENDFFNSSGFTEERDAVRVAYKLVGKTDAAADEFYDDNIGLWNLIGRKLIAVQVGPDNKAEYKMISISDIENY